MLDNTASLGLSMLKTTLSYIVMLLMWGIGYGFLYLVGHKYMLLDPSDLWRDGSVAEGLRRVWFIFVWGAVVTLLSQAFYGGVVTFRPKWVLLIDGWWLSSNAGFFEEIMFRWFVFFSAMVLMPFFNFITFGLVEWLYVHLLLPLADFTTLYALHDYLFHPGSWVFGAAIVSASIAFRNAHEHLKWFGRINAWFIGMVLFYLVFHFGLWTAIVAHVAYDIVVFSLAALMARE